jgi:S-adenosylmethionine hydrolase
MSIITLTTDYGLRDQYVGALKGVILSIAPSACLVDITHDIDPHNILHGAFVLRQVWPWYPKGTIHVVVVDPGVGSERRIILGRYAGQYVIAPDNGLVTLIHREMPVEALHVVEARRYFLGDLSSTFHGRDIMAPVAAHLANGVSPREFGRATDRLEILPGVHRAEVEGDVTRGMVLYVDRFGTLISNVGADQLSGAGVGCPNSEVLVDGVSVGPLRSAFCDVPPGEPVAFIGSGGLVEVAVNRGRAVDRFGPDPQISVEFR